VWDEVLPDSDPAVAWYRSDAELELSSSSDAETRDDPEEPDPDVDDPLPATAMTDPSPRNATTLDAAAILRARPAGCRRRRRPLGVARSPDMRPPCRRTLARSLKTPAETVLRDAWAGS
jgi:hypothetical protein